MDSRIFQTQNIKIGIYYIYVDIVDKIIVVEGLHHEALY